MVRRAAPASEELRQTLGMISATLDLQFDDFRLIATIRGPEAAKEMIAEPDTLLNGAVDRAARNISRRYGCGVKLNTVREIVFDLEHQRMG